MSHINPTRDQFRALHGLPDNEPIGLLNLLKFRDQAQYEDRGLVDVEPRRSGREAYERYSEEARESFLQAGGRQLWIGQPLITVIGPSDTPWDLAFVAWYPSAPAFTEMVTRAAYQRAARHRTAALSDSRLIVCASLEAGLSFAPRAYRPPS